jgi:KDO2-lipid IV(A) lauroyltransferase
MRSESSLGWWERVLALIVEWMARAWAWVPLSGVRIVAFLLGTLGDLFPNRERWIVETNLALCFPDDGEADRTRLRRRNLRQTAMTFAEMPATWYRSDEYWRRRINLNGFDIHLHQLLRMGRGVIACSPHLGNWEVGMLTLMQVAPVTVMYRPPNQPWLESVLISGRQKRNARLVPADGTGVRRLSRTLKSGGMVGILPDQAPKKITQGAGEFAPFFGEPAYTMTLVSRLAARHRTPVVVGFAQRTTGGAFEARWCDVGDAIWSADPTISVAALNVAVETCVRMCPDQYLWAYKRFVPYPKGHPFPYARKSG